ncbi:hypothetical protein GCM10010327_69300 [Streptomyces nitrosporeus]|nr:hypothetical protein GCM10010327_69300 [Streptomyces nitrosporeus]
MRAGSTGSRGTATRGASGRPMVRRGGQGVVIFGLAFVVRIQERTVVRALYGGPPDYVSSRS